MDATLKIAGVNFGVAAKRGYSDSGGVVEPGARGKIGESTWGVSETRQDAVTHWQRVKPKECETESEMTEGLKYRRCE